MDRREPLPVGIVEALQSGATIVTGNQRAARTLRRAYDRENRRLGLTNWQPPAIFAWASWTSNLWRELLLEGHATQLLMNSMQEHVVWRTVLESDEELSSLRSVNSLTEMAAQAWELLCQYEAREKLRRAATNSDTLAFQRWANAFERACKAEGLLSQAQLETTLRNSIEAGHLQSDKSAITLIGFDATTPAQARLIEALRLSGTPVNELHLTVSTETRILVTTENEAEELSVAARWIRTFLEQQPDAKIAVIVPKLESQRAEIDRVFCEILSPELENIQAQENPVPYEFSLGVPLAATPMVSTALTLLHWIAAPLPLEKISALLLSPYFCMSHKEYGIRAEFDAFELRQVRMLRPEISLQWLSTIVDRSKRVQGLGNLPETLRTINRFSETHLRKEVLQTYAEWSTRMREFLELARWGANDGEDSIEFQTRRKWEIVLDQLSTLDFDGRPVSFSQSLEDVDRIARQTIFAPESHDAPVQIMGPLEAAGATFDAVWFLRAGDLSWPVAPRTNPLLPWQMQRELGMPGADITRNSAASQNITERTANSAGTSVFSYAKETPEGKQRRSPMLNELKLEETAVTDLVMPLAKREPLLMVEIEDTAPIRPLPDEVIHGGARILELQAACGFRAFAEQRLWSTEIESVELGMNARERGTIVHRALEFFWERVQTQHALREMNPDSRTKWLNECIGRALQKASELRTTPWDDAYITVQAERLHRLLAPWLELELKRAPFEVKVSEKEFADVHVGPLRLNVRMDRVDVVEGGEVLIDYKTGLASPNDWLTERPTAPQLPLYAILSDPKKLQGVAFGLVRAGEAKDLLGYAVNNEILPKVTRMKLPSLEAQVEEWRHVLEHLAEEFASGIATVTPSHYPSTCAHCSQRILCRLDISLLEENDHEDEATEEERG